MAVAANLTFFFYLPFFFSLDTLLSPANFVMFTIKHLHWRYFSSSRSSYSFLQSTFSTQLFCIESLMNLLLYIKWLSRRLEIRLRKKWVWEFDIRWSANFRDIYPLSTSPLDRNLAPFDVSYILKRNLSVFQHSLWTL